MVLVIETSIEQELETGALVKIDPNITLVSLRCQSHTEISTHLLLRYGCHAIFKAIKTDIFHYSNVLRKKENNLKHCLQNLSAE